MKSSNRIVLICVIAVALASWGFIAVGRYGYRLGYQERVKEDTAQAKVERLNNETIVSDVNAFRASNSLPALKYNFLLEESASLKCDDMVKNHYVGHVNPTTRKQGYEYITQLIPTAKTGGEDYTSGTFTSNQQVVDSWINSPDHRASLLNPVFTDAGVATCRVPGQPEGSITVVLHLAQL